MRRYVPILIAGMALIAAACSDTIAPAKQPASLTRFGDRSFSSVVGENEDSNAVVYHFDIPAAGGTVTVGEFTVKFDSNSVCDPSTTSYGAEFWLDDCQTLATDFPITARFFTSDGKSFVEFLPDIRFHPAKIVTISIVRPEFVGVELTQEQLDLYEIWYSRVIGEIRYFIDESWTDPTVVTQYNPETGAFQRRVRHFSILLWAGYCLENPEDPMCLGELQP